jgi:RNA polymerase sigma-70 factor (ECF subfamily)
VTSVDADVVAAIEQAHRAEWGLVLASAARLAGGDVGVAEEATADAFLAAWQTWPVRGVPTRPGAWLTQTAKRRVLDRLRRDATLRRRMPALATDALVAQPGPEPDEGDEEGAVLLDDRLRLVFTCCHPTLSMEARTALTLRMVCGMSTEEIAHAFLVPEATMAARLTRAKKKIAAAAIPYRVPSMADMSERLDGVLTVIHLLFTAGHTASVGVELIRVDLVERAMDLARVLTALLPDEPECLGLLSLLEFTDSRRAARVDDHGDLVLLSDQDRGRWDAEQIQLADRHLERALQMTSVQRPPGRFVLQAAASAVHHEVPAFELTDFAALVAVYDRLLATWPSPVVAVNRAVAVSFASGPAAGLAALDAVDAESLRDYHYLPATRADLLRRIGDVDAAADEYRRALAMTSSPAEQRFLQRRLTEVSGRPSSGGCLRSGRCQEPTDAGCGDHDGRPEHGQPIGRDPALRPPDVDHRDRTLVGAEHGRADPVGELCVLADTSGVAESADGGQLRLQRGAVGDGGVGEALELMGQGGVAFLRSQPGQERLAARRGVQ